MHAEARSFGDLLGPHIPDDDDLFDLYDDDTDLILDTTSFLSPPDNGFKTITGWDTSKVFTGVSPLIRARWDQSTATKLFVYPFNAGAESDTAATALLLKRAISNIFDSENLLDIKVGEPMKTPERGLNKGPWLYIVAHLSEPRAMLLTAQQVWITPTISFIAIPYLPNVSTFAFSLQNFTFPNNELGRQEVQAIVAYTISASKKIDNFIRITRDAAPPALTPSQVKERIIDSIQVVGLDYANPGNTGTFTTIWNVYLSSPTNNPTYHEEWISILLENEYTGEFEGQGIPYLPLPCSVCKSNDHTTGVCPFPQLPGWRVHTSLLENGPTIATTRRTNSTATQGEGRGRGRSGQPTRGRGRGAIGRG
jgi:hypothetical protein